ncbi:MAG: protein kinase domain-containing protein [Gemmatimonadaceae bacterium]
MLTLWHPPSVVLRNPKPAVHIAATTLRIGVADFIAQLQAHFAGEYTVERELSGGGMAQVVLAKDVRLNRRVVIKLLPASVTAAISAERFEREIMVSASLQHPNIVPVLSSGKVNGLPYFVMPYIDGESLRTRIRRGPLSVRETVSILKDVCRALTFAHAKGVIHRDIKPDNVLLSTGAGAAVVTDFGVAKALSAARHGVSTNPGASMTGVGMSPGTPAYMAPEQAAADPNIDHRADLYALGILGYEMLAGAPPFHGRSPQTLLAAQMTEAPTPLSARRYDVPKALNDLLMQCLAKEPSERPESSTSLLRSLEDPDVISGIFAAPAASKRGEWRLFAMLGGGLVVLVLLGEFVRSRLAPDPPAASAPISPPAANGLALAVVPLAIVGGDARARTVADALSAELTTAMATVSGLRVVSPSSVLAVSDSARTPAALRAALNVTHVLEGTVQRERAQLRATLRLVRIDRDSTIWAQTFNGNSDSTLTFQDLVVRAAVAALRDRGR